MKIVVCSRCDSIGWVSEWAAGPAGMFSGRLDACNCKGAAMPCEKCNTKEPPRLPHDFEVLCERDPDTLP